MINLAVVDITIKNRIASAPAGVLLVCNNPTDTIRFTFDAEWDAHTARVARFEWEGEFVDVPFTGNEVKAPEITKTLYVNVGVYSDDITSTPVKLQCKRSILCYGESKRVPPDNTSFEELREFIDDLNEASSQYTKYEERMLALEEANAEVESMVGTYDSRITAVQKQVTAIDADVTACEDEISAVKNQVTTTNTKIAAVETQATAISNRVTGVENQADSLEAFVKGSEEGASVSGEQVLFESTEGAPFEAVTVFSPSQDGIGDPCTAGNGKNLFPAPDKETSVVSAGITFLRKTDGTIVLNGTSTAVAAIYLPLPKTIPSGTSMALSLGNPVAQGGSTTDNSVCIRVTSEGAYVTGIKISTHMATAAGEQGIMVASETFDAVGVQVRVASGMTLTNFVIKPQIEIGNAVTEYAPYANIRPIVEHTGAALAHCGKNLLPFPYAAKSGTTSGGITFVCGSDGSVTVSGTSTAKMYHYLTPYSSTHDTGLSLPAGDYIFSSGLTGGSASTYRIQISIYKNGVYQREYPVYSGSRTVHVNDGEFVDMYFTCQTGGITLNNLTFRPQLEPGTTATAYEPYKVSGHSVGFGQIVGGGWIDWSAGSLTMTHEVRTLTGLEGWGATISDAPYYFLSTEDYGYVDESGEQLCSHFVRDTITNATTGIGFSVFNSAAVNKVRIAIRPNISSVTDTVSWKSYLNAQFMAGTPVTVVYALTEPRTIPITPQVLRALGKTNLLSCELGISTVTIPANLTNLLRVDARAQKALPPVKSNVLITDFEWLVGHWNESGGWIDTTHDHSQLIPVIGGKPYYLGFKYDTLVHGAFFDIHGNWIAPLLPEDVTAYSYKTAYGYGIESDYVELYTFTAPEGASYFSYNLSTASNWSYRQFVASSPVFALSGTGNYAWDDDEPNYQAKKDKRLCIIGASGVTQNRCLKENPEGSGVYQYIVGFPEYLVPWYAQVDSYGYSGTPWGDYGSTGESSIYSHISDLDFSQYDEFILNPSSNDLTTGLIGDAEKIVMTDTVTDATYMGALRLTLDKIYNESPNAKVYMVNLVHKGSYYTNADTKTLHDALNAEFVKFSDMTGVELIDLVRGGGINKYTYSKGKMTYDNTHLNHEGNKAMGLYLRKQIIGF